MASRNSLIFILMSLRTTSSGSPTGTFALGFPKAFYSGLMACSCPSHMYPILYDAIIAHAVWYSRAYMS